MTLVDPVKDHPAPFPDEILSVLRGLVRGERDRLGRKPRLLDPCAGIGKIHRLNDVADTWGVEIEAEWAACHRRTRHGDARKMPRTWTARFDVVATSVTYANRMADHHNARDASKRHGYKFSLGRDLTSGNTGGMQWGDEYRSTHVEIVGEIERVLVDEGLLLLNVSNHFRDKQLQRVNEWWLSMLLDRGWWLNAVLPVVTRRLPHGAHADARADFEVVMALRRPGAVIR